MLNTLLVLTVGALILYYGRRINISLARSVPLMSKLSEQVSELSLEVTELKNNVGQVAANSAAAMARLEAKLRAELGEPDPDLSAILDDLKGANDTLAGLSGSELAPVADAGASEDAADADGEGAGAPGDGSTSGVIATEGFTQPTDFSDTERESEDDVPVGTGEPSSAAEEESDEASPDQPDESDDKF